MDKNQQITELTKHYKIQLLKLEGRIREFEVRIKDLETQNNGLIGDVLALESKLLDMRNMYELL
jgi:hypothetical protein